MPESAAAVTRSSMNRARATIAARKPRVNTGCMSGRSAPAVGRVRQPQPDRVRQHRRLPVDLQVQRPPQRHSHGRLICLGNYLLISHGDTVPASRSQSFIPNGP